MFLLYTTNGTVFKKGTMTDRLPVCNNKTFHLKMTGKWAIQIFSRNGNKWAMNVRKMMNTAIVKIKVFSVTFWKTCFVIWLWKLICKEYVNIWRVFFQMSNVLFQYYTSEVQARSKPPSGMECGVQGWYRLHSLNQPLRNYSLSHFPSYQKIPRLDLVASVWNPDTETRDWEF